MFGNRSFLVLGGETADLMSLIKGGYEMANCQFSFQQGIDDKGKATTKVFGGAIHLTLPQFPPSDIIEWALQSRSHKDGMIVLLDAENLPVEKVLFQNAYCIDFEIDYTMEGQSYAATKLVIQAEILIVGDGIDFDNEWTK
jgi:hypothetical protein